MKRQTSKSEGFDPARRAALLKLGRFAIYTAPVMTTLLIGREAQAHAGDCPRYDGNPDNPGKDTGDIAHDAQWCTVSSVSASPSAEKSSGEDFSYTPDPGPDSGSSGDE